MTKITREVAYINKCFQRNNITLLLKAWMKLYLYRIKHIYHEDMIIKVIYPFFNSSLLFHQQRYIVHTNYGIFDICAYSFKKFCREKHLAEPYGKFCDDLINKDRKYIDTRLTQELFYANII
jgi:hypothetical protein